MAVGWVRVGVSPIGGLTDVGFSQNGRFLLVVGHQGRGVLDSQTGERLARDPEDDWSYFDEASGTVAGIGPLEGQSIGVAGLMSRRRLPVRLGDWSARATSDGVTLRSSTAAEQTIPENEELRAFGFAPDGTTFVIGTPSSATLYRLVE